MGQSNAMVSDDATCRIGKDRRGHWVVQGPNGKFGGLFVSRQQALKFAMFEGGEPHAAVMVPYPLELDVATRRPR
jgi:hypothetical protein